MSVQTQQVGQRPVMDEVPVRAAGIHVSLILNRRHRVARLVERVRAARRPEAR